MTLQLPKGRLGDRLVENGRITEDQLVVALAEQKRAHRPLGEILRSLGFCRQEDIAELLAEDMGLAYRHDDDLEADPLVTASLDHDFVRETGAFPYALQDGTLKVAMVSPDDPVKVALVRKRFPYALEFEMTSERNIMNLLSRFIDAEVGRVATIFAQLQASDGEGHQELPIEAITEALLIDGVNQSATDIHIEPEERITRVRFRVDGVLVQGENLPQASTAAIISRIKILSGLDISERRRPQDGRLGMNIDGRDIDMRVSVMPCTYGENVVLRILDRNHGASRGMQGLEPLVQKVLRSIVERPHGLFLVTGPTGSGKTTTLYGMLGMVDALRRNVATIEDPVEYRMPLIRQSQVDNSIGFNFHNGLRSLLRQDPDVILIGEIRDKETADMAVKASMTGHLVLSTLHTNSALGTLSRLVDIGIESYLVEDCLIGAMGQRLVRKVCEYCAQPVQPSQAELDWLGTEALNLMRGTGCARCCKSGLAGRTAIIELFTPSDAVAEAIRKGVSQSGLYELATQAGFRSIEEDGKRLVRLGITTMQEVRRVSASHRLSEAECEAI